MPVCCEAVLKKRHQRFNIFFFVGNFGGNNIVESSRQSRMIPIQFPDVQTGALIDLGIGPGKLQRIGIIFRHGDMMTAGSGHDADQSNPAADFQEVLVF